MAPFLFAAALITQFGPIGPDMPAREPQMAASGSTVVLTFGGGKAIYASVSHDSGKSFGVAVKVAESEILPLNRHRGPRIAMSGRTIVISAVGGTKAAEGTHAHGLPSDGDLWAWRSVDEGKTWSKGVRINDVTGAPTEGLHTLAADTKGNLFAAWLDKRGEGTKLYAARSNDGGVTWTRNALVYESPEGSICQCCHPSAVFTADGTVAVMWRNWLGGSRDMYLSRSTDGFQFTKPERLGFGTWKLNACPMDGGGIVVSQGRLVTAWRREGEIFLAIPGEKEVSLGKGIDVAVAPAANGVYAVWTAPEGVVAMLPDKERLQLAPIGSFPIVISVGGGHALAAWETDGRIQIVRLP